MKNEKILVGKIVAAQGLRGELRVNTFTETPADIGILPLGLKFIRAIGKNLAICKMDGVDDRTAAEALIGRELYITRADLPPAKDGEYYITDLLGMTVGEHTVIDVVNFGAGDILELSNGEMVSFKGAKLDFEKRSISF